MKKKFIISFMAVVVFVGLTVFAYAQDALPPSDSKVIECPSGEALMIVFDQDGKFAEAYYGSLEDGVFVKDLEEPVLIPYTGYVCSDATKDDCRFVLNNETTYFCGSIGGGAAGVFFRR
jgi:hypothetical protein